MYISVDQMPSQECPTSLHSGARRDEKSSDMRRSPVPTAPPRLLLSLPPSSPLTLPPPALLSLLFTPSSIGDRRRSWRTDWSRYSSRSPGGSHDGSVIIGWRRSLFLEASAAPVSVDVFQAGVTNVSRHRGHHAAASETDAHHPTFLQYSDLSIRHPDPHCCLPARHPAAGLPPRQDHHRSPAAVQ